MHYQVSAQDRDLIRKLAARVAVIAHSDAMATRRRDWANLNGLRGERPMIITEHQGVAAAELEPYRKPECTGDWARILEATMKSVLFTQDVAGDDAVIEPTLRLQPGISSSGYGVESTKHRGDAGESMGSMVWDAPLKHLPEDVATLRKREFTADTAEWERQRVAAQEVVGDLLEVVVRPWLWWTQGLTIVAIDLMGLEPMLYAMADNPDGLHALMAFLRDDHLNALNWHEAQGLLYVNNRDDYFGSGGCGYTNDLPGAGHVSGQPARLKDTWGLCESQETVGVSPAMFEEFVLPYQLPVIERFGLAYYGCCEPIDKRLDLVKRIPNLRAVSVSPWSNVRFMAEQLGRDYIMCRKPNPAFFSAPTWDEDVIRRDLRDAIEASKGCNVQLVLKDVHTVHHQLWRYGRWVAIAREEIARVYA